MNYARYNYHKFNRMKVHKCTTDITNSTMYIKHVHCNKFFLFISLLQILFNFTKFYLSSCSNHILNHTQC